MRCLCFTLASLFSVFLNSLSPYAYDSLTHATNSLADNENLAAAAFSLRPSTMRCGGSGDWRGVTLCPELFGRSVQLFRLEHLYRFHGVIGQLRVQRQCPRRRHWAPLPLIPQRWNHTYWPSLCPPPPQAPSCAADTGCLRLPRQPLLRPPAVVASRSRALGLGTRLPGQVSLREILAAGRRLADQRRTKGGHTCCRHSETR